MTETNEKNYWKIVKAGLNLTMKETLMLECINCAGFEANEIMHCASDSCPIKLFRKYHKLPMRITDKFTERIFKRNKKQEN